MKHPNDKVRQAAAAAWRDWINAALWKRSVDPDLFGSYEAAFTKHKALIEAAPETVNEWAYTLFQTLMAYVFTTRVRPIVMTAESLIKRAHHPGHPLGVLAQNGPAPDLVRGPFPEMVGHRKGMVTRFFTQEDLNMLRSFYTEASATLMEVHALLSSRGEEEKRHLYSASMEVRTALNNMGVYFPDILQMLESLLNEDFEAFLGAAYPQCPSDVKAPYASTFWLLSMAQALSGLNMERKFNAVNEATPTAEGCES